jgi:UPF0755 protein
MRKRVETILWLSAALVCLAAVHSYSVLYTPASWERGEGGEAGKPVTTTVTVARGASFRVVANMLEREGIVKDSKALAFAAALKGAQKKIKAGEYELSSAMTPMEILEHLVEGRTKHYSITFPEGYNIKEIAASLEGAGLADRNGFIKKAKDKRVVAALGLEGPGLEGYLFPDTYRFTKGMNVEEIILKMVGRFKEVYENAGLSEQARKEGFTVKQVVTIASIVEKEAGSVEEMEKISSVFHNRLKKGYRLRSDPTVIYGIEDFDGNLTKRHLLTYTPYNTYINLGLPPGPVSNPGRAAFHAALNPSEEGYLYFVSRNDGTHHFSKTLKEHNRAVDYYQKGILSRKPNG